MKQIILFFLLFSTCVVYGQKEDPIYFQPSEKSVKNFNVSKEYNPQMEIDFVKHCLKKYRDQRRTGFILEVVGGIVVGAGYSGTEQDSKLMVVGCAISFIGAITILDSDKWMKRAYVGPNGVGIKFTF